MKHEVRAEADIAGAAERMAAADDSPAPPQPGKGSGRRTQQTGSRGNMPEVLNVADILALDLPEPKTLIEGTLAMPGLILMVGAPKSGKTVLAVQSALAVASGAALFDYYRVLEPGPVMIVEQDDPAGTASVKTILLRAKIDAGVPFHLVPRVPFSFGLEFLQWLEGQVGARKLRLVVLDSYTALRGPRRPGVDIVKAEQMDLNLMDDLAKRTGCTIIVITHDSKGRAGMDWDARAAGTFAMTAATEGQIHISRFADLDSNAPERLVRIRGRHVEGNELVLRFRAETLNYEHVLEGGAAPLYPLVLTLRSTFGAQAFSPKDVSQATGVSRATAHRHLDRLHRAGAITKRGFGSYAFADMRQ